MNHSYRSILLITLFLTLIGCQDSKPSQTKEERSRPVQVIEIKDNNQSQIKSFNGTVRAKNSTSLSFRVPGTIETVQVKKGDRIEKGQLIASLDPHDYQVTLEELQARMVEAQSAHKLANAELKRIKQAIQDNAIADVNLDRAKSGYERSLSAIKVVEKNIQRAKDALRYTKLHAPFSGVIADVNVDPFEQALPGGNIVTLQDNQELNVDIDVPENLIQQFYLDQSAQITWYGSKHPLNASVSEISPAKHLIKQTYTVTLMIDSQSPELLSGKSVTVSIPFSNDSSAHCLPYSAILGKHQDLFVNVIRNEQVHAEPVSLQSLNAHQTCVIGKLSVGDNVVIAGSHYLHTGDRISNLSVKAQ